MSFLLWILVCMLNKLAAPYLQSRRSPSISAASGRDCVSLECHLMSLQPRKLNEEKTALNILESITFIRNSVIELNYRFYKHGHFKEGVNT